MPVLSGHRRLGWGLLVLGLGLALGSGAAPNLVRPSRPAFSEYQIKAVFLFNFVQFIEWPASAFAGPDDPLVIGVLGENPFGGALDQAVRGEQVGGRSLVVKYGRRLEEVRSCHLLFVARSENERLANILPALRGSGVLTVGETEVFMRAGGIISFLVEGNKVRFAIDPEAAQQEGLRLSVKLLKVARIASHGLIQEER